MLVLIFDVIIYRAWRYGMDKIAKWTIQNGNQGNLYENFHPKYCFMGEIYRLFQELTQEGALALFTLFDAYRNFAAHAR